MPNQLRLQHHTSRLFAVMTAAMLITTTPAALRAQASTVTASNAWVREAVAGRKVTGVFVILANSGSAARSVVSGVTDVADTLELHEMVRKGSEARMSPVKSIEVPAGGTMELKPGSYHLMLFGLKRPLPAGDSIHVMLTLDNGSKVSFAAQVRKPGPMP